MEVREKKLLWLICFLKELKHTSARQTGEVSLENLKASSLPKNRYNQADPAQCDIQEIHWSSTLNLHYYLSLALHTLFSQPTFQLYDLWPVGIFMWTTKWFLCVNIFPQVLQWYGLSPAWLLISNYDFQSNFCHLFNRNMVSPLYALHYTF